MDEHEEELARFRAEFDQLVEGVKNIARAAWAMYAESLDQGFTSDQAFRLTVSYLCTHRGVDDD